MRDQFYLSQEITYLNHGSFGACPKPIMEDYQRWQRTLEEEPVQFITKRYYDALSVSKKLFAGVVGCAPEDFFFLQNPTTAVNQVVKGLDLKPGDEVLTTDHEYGALDKTFDFYAKKKGFVNRRQKISLPLLSKEQFIEEFWKGYTDKTKAVFLSHFTSTTALIFPVKEICERAKELGLITIVDGAHVPGHVPLNLTEIKADFYTGTLHKWLLAPKGCAFLYVNKDFQNIIEPLIISWGYEAVKPTKSKFLEENELQGTRDCSAYLTAPAILKFFEENNMKDRQAACRRIILQQYPVFCELLGTKPLCTVSGDFLGQMCSIPITPGDPFVLKETLYKDYKIEIPVMQRGNDTYLRISYQAYNTMDDLQRLKDVVLKIKNEGKLL
ncbi:MAG: aminotransferase class V-fold PLP-dependent enzyme [Bacteroidetes bacterium]|nr:aminotransferase class V-fold PLP-dependent enzyme [Bacteroidota bacterium]MBS1935205.1 aminotransferase class V-fold PLP-dependent enzyme [Bacteroidota bacterium]